MHAGQPIKVVAEGGSVTKGHGPIHRGNSWLHRFYSWVNETFPHPDHQLINQAIPAVRPLETFFRHTVSICNEETCLGLIAKCSNTVIANGCLAFKMNSIILD